MATTPFPLHPQLSKEEYDKFFEMTFKEFLPPLAHAHFNVEGTIEFSAMLFVPGMAPFEQQVTSIVGTRILRIAAKQGPSVLFCMRSRTNSIPFVSVM
jgi:Hsp90 protein